MPIPKPPQNLTQERAERRAQALAGVVVQAFTEKLRREIEKHGGFLGVRHVDGIEAEFQAKAKQLSAAFAQAFEDAAREQEELRWHAIKRPAFDRLIVKRFEHLFMRRGGDGRMHGAVSRRILPGFFLALNMMLGPEAVAEYQFRCDAAVERVMRGQVPVDWERVDNDAEVHDVILDAELAIAQHFVDTQRRFSWFIHITNSHMAPASGGAHGEADWELGHRALHVLLHSLLGDLKKAIADELAWRHLAERHPDADRQQIETVLARLD